MDTIWRFRLRSGDGLWFEPDYGATIDIDTIEVADPRPNAEELLIATQAFATSDAGHLRIAARAALERLALAKVAEIKENGVRARREKTAALRRDAAAKAAAQEAERFASLARKQSLARYHKIPEHGTKEHRWQLQYAKYARAACRPGPLRSWGLEIGGTFYAIVAPTVVAAVGALITDCRLVRPRHREPPFSTLPAYVFPFNDFDVPAALTKRMARAVTTEELARVVERLPPVRPVS